MTSQKRMLDLMIAVLLVPLVVPIMAVIALVISVRDGGPVFYVSERIGEGLKPFMLIKFRTMRSGQNRQGVTGADKSALITTSGVWLRRYRLDELPQVWNVLRGDLSFVGPRPPLGQYVSARPDLYEQVLACRPGITGLATLVFHRHEYLILNQCNNELDTHQAYLRRCVPRKARLDLVYRRRVSNCLDLFILARTVWAILR